MKTLILLLALTLFACNEQFPEPEEVIGQEPVIEETYYMQDGELKIEDDGESIAFYTDVVQYSLSYIKSSADTTEYKYDTVPLFKRKDVYKIQDGKIVFDKKYKGTKKTKSWIEWKEF